MNTGEKLLTTKEVANKLGVVKATVYKYIKEKKIKPVYEDNWRIDTTLLFREEEVDQLIDKNKKPGLTTGDVAKKLNIHQTTVTKYISEGKLRATKKKYKGREVYFIEEEDFISFSENNTFERYKSKDFHTPDGQFHLFQSFRNNLDVMARIMAINKEGKALTSEGNELKLQDLSRNGFESKYEVSKKDHLTKRGYAAFRFPKPHDLDSSIYRLIERFYQTIGPKNMRLSVNDFINLEVKPTLLIDVTEDELKILQSNIIEGNISTRHNGIYIDSDLESHLVHLPKNIKEDLRKEAAVKNMTLEEYTLQIIKNRMVD
ncbi:helix-turn-helix domain-containing protein [Halobacillus litoralis]|uniref:Helix-turn-helix domain-containing protein n=1 Tax=Halobacillus litoralis TaxID=45668 RepID=A0A410MJ82_9BACI|nr:helix-turn-helix domain-containing protein [Halobacillus litoralis]QAS54750.1 hypothetical protein HLI_21065 [Halobacillus litoralis]